MPAATEIREGLKALPASDRRSITVEAVRDMSADERREIAGIVGSPTQPVTNQIWLRVVTAFVIVLVGAFGAMAVFVFMDKKPDTLLTVFTTVAAFLGGLLAPSPVTAKPN